MESLGLMSLLRKAQIGNRDEVALGRNLLEISKQLKPEAQTFILSAIAKADGEQDPAKRLTFLRNFTQQLRVEIAYRSIGIFEPEMVLFSLTIGALFALLPMSSRMGNKFTFVEAFEMAPNIELIAANWLGFFLATTFTVLVQKEQFKQELFELCEKVGTTRALSLLPPKIRPSAEAEVRARARANRLLLNPMKELLPVHLALNLTRLCSPQEIRDAYPKMEPAQSVSIEQLRELFQDLELFGSGELSIEVAKTALELSKKLGSNGLQAAAAAARAGEFAGARSLLSDPNRSNEVIQKAIALLYQ